MKFSSLLVVGSLALNAGLVAVYFSRTPAAPAAVAEATSAGTAGSTISPSSGPSAGETTSSAVKKATKSSGAKDAENTWASLNTGDLRALAARLRAAGFPPSMVRAVVNAQLSESFKTRREQLMPPTTDRPFWQTDATGMGFSVYSDPKYFAASRDLGREQNQALKEILGADATPPGAANNEYLVRRFGNLPQDKLELLQRLDQDYNDLRNEVNRTARGMMLPEDREKLAMLEREKRVDLAQLLTPAEADDYLMRTSQTTMRLRQTLTSFDATEPEFRAIYQAQAAFDEKYSNVMGMMTAELSRERQGAQTQVGEDIKAALGEARYAELIRAADREYQQLSRMAQQASLPEATAIQVLNMRDTALKESNRIFEDASLNNDQKRAAIQAVGQTARSQAVSTLGPDAGQRYVELAQRWLSALERGAAVTMVPSVLGTSSMNTRNVPTARPAPNAGAVPAPAAK